MHICILRTNRREQYPLWLFFVHSLSLDFAYFTFFILTVSHSQEFFLSLFDLIPFSFFLYLYLSLSISFNNSLFFCLFFSTLSACVSVDLNFDLSRSSLTLSLSSIVTLIFIIFVRFQKLILEQMTLDFFSLVTVINSHQLFESINWIQARLLFSKREPETYGRKKRLFVLVFSSWNGKMFESARGPFFWQDATWFDETQRQLLNTLYYVERSTTFIWKQDRKQGHVEN